MRLAFGGIEKATMERQLFNVGREIAGVYPSIPPSLAAESGEMTYLGSGNSSRAKIGSRGSFSESRIVRLTWV